MLGNLVISPQSAHITHTTKRFSLMDPFVRVIIGNQMQDSNVAKNFHKEPYWRSELTFVCPNDQVINFEIWDKCKMGKDKLIGSSSFTLSALGDRNFFFDWLPLYYKDKQAGQLLVWLHFYPIEQNKMGSQYPMSQTSMIQQPTSMQTMMPMSMQPQMMGGMNSMPMDSGMGSMSGNPMMSNATLGSTRMVNYSSTNPPDKNITVLNNDRVQYMERPLSREMNSGMSSIDRDHTHFQGHDHFHTSSMADSEMRHMGSENRNMMGMRPFSSGMTSGMDSMPRTKEGMSIMPMQGMRPMGSESTGMMGMTSPRHGDYVMMSSMPNMTSQRMGGDKMGMNSAGMTSMPMSNQTMGRGMDYMDSNPGMGRDMMMGMHSRNESMPGSHGKLSSMMRSMRTDAKEMLGMDPSRRPYSSGGHERMSSMPVSGMGYMGSGNRNMMGMRPLSSGMTSGMDSMPRTQEGMFTMPMLGMRPMGSESRGIIFMESRGGNYPSMMNSMPMMSNTGMSRDAMAMNPNSMSLQSGMESMPQGGMSSMSTMGSSNREMQGMRPSSFKTMGSNLQSDPYRNFSMDMMGNRGMRPMSRDAQSVISSIPYDSGMNSGIGSLNSLGGNSSMGNQNQMGSNSGMGMMSSNIPFTISMPYKPNFGTSNMSSFNPSNIRKTNLDSSSMFPSNQRGIQMENEGGYGDGSGLDKIISNLDSDRFNSGKYSKMPGAGKETMEASGEMLSGYAMGGPAMTGPMLGSEMKTDKLSAASMQDQRRPYSY